MFGVMNHLKIKVCQSSEEARAEGYFYNEQQFRGQEIKAIEIEEVVLVRNGTVGGNSTVDIILKTVEGERFVVMMTANLLKSIPA